jgi:hypothetical protein
VVMLSLTLLMSGIRDHILVLGLYFSPHFNGWPLYKPPVSTYILHYVTVYKNLLNFPEALRRRSKITSRHIYK